MFSAGTSNCIWTGTLADKFTREKRSSIMASISGKETKPEILVRRLLFSRGFRYRKNVTSLPGKPDIVLPKYRTAVFIHGCFWHYHEGCPKATIPETRTDQWRRKITENKIRDDDNMGRLRQQGWQVLVVWQCEISNIGKRTARLDTLAADIVAGAPSVKTDGPLTLRRLLLRPPPPR